MGITGLHADTIIRNANIITMDPTQPRASALAIRGGKFAAEPLYSQLRVNGNLERVLKNINGFQEIRAKHYPNSRIITRASGVKVSEDQQLDEMESFWGGMVDQVAFVAYNAWENTYQK
jgi:hypothetical protein